MIILMLVLAMAAFTLPTTTVGAARGGAASALAPAVSRWALTMALALMVALLLLLMVGPFLWPLGGGVTGVGGAGREGGAGLGEPFPESLLAVLFTHVEL